MARRRMIDPNFWQSEDVAKLTIRQRLLFIGIFSNADDEGKLRGNPAFVRSAIFPYEDFALSEIEDDLNRIESIGSILQYEVEGSKYIRLINWKKFQRVDKPQSSVIPEPVKNDSENDSKNDSCLKEEKGKEVKGKESEYIHSTEDDFKKVSKAYAEIHKVLELPYSNGPLLSNLLNEGIPSEHIIGVMKEKFKEGVKTLKFYDGAIRDSWNKPKLVHSKPAIISPKAHIPDPNILRLLKEAD